MAVILWETGKKYKNKMYTEVGKFHWEVTIFRQNHNPIDGLEARAQNIDKAPFHNTPKRTSHTEIVMLYQNKLSNYKSRISTEVWTKLPSSFFCFKDRDEVLSTIRNHTEAVQSSWNRKSSAVSRYWRNDTAEELSCWRTELNSAARTQLDPCWWLNTQELSLIIGFAHP